MNDDDDILRRASAFLARSRGSSDKDFPILTEAVPPPRQQSNANIAASSNLRGKANGPGFSFPKELSDEAIARLSNEICRSILDELKINRSLLLERVLKKVEEVVEQEIESTLHRSLSDRIATIVKQSLAKSSGNAPGSPTLDSE